MEEKPCTGTVYIVDGKRWCVGEKKISKKWGSKKSNKSNKSKKSKKSKKNKPKK
jgi:hypothetical protein